MRSFTRLAGFCATAILLSGCAYEMREAPSPLPAPYRYLTLSSCRSYGANVVECQLSYGTESARRALGPVQDRPSVLGGLAGSYQLTSCYQTVRISRELPNFVCRIRSTSASADEGSVLIKGGTAVHLARLLGDSEQIQYRWKPDRWSRVDD